MKVLGVIPARGGSKGIPGKNGKILCGKPLIRYTIDEAIKSKLSTIVVSSDDDNILEISSIDGVTLLKRPAELAQDDTPTLPVLQHVIKKIGKQFDAVMTLQPTSPLRTFKHIDEAINLLKSNEEADSLVSVEKVPHNMGPISISKLNKKGFLDQYLKQKNEIVRRQDKPVFYARNGAAIYITRINRIEKYIFGGNILPYHMSKINSIDIDDDDDWKLVELILNGRK